MSMRMPRLILFFACVCSTMVCAADLPPATVTEAATTMTLENGLVSITMARRGNTTGRNGDAISIKYKTPSGYVELSDEKRAMYFDAGGGRAYPVADADSQIVLNTPEMVEVSWNGKPTQQFPFAAEMHVILRRGEPGFHIYVNYQHGPGMGAGGIGETRFVLRGVPGPELFTHHIVDDQRKGPYPTSPAVSQVQDATSLLEDGTIYTKYNNTAFMADHHVHGMAGHGLGMWMIFPSNEFIGGGPFKQELTVHQGNTLLGMFVGGHFGSGGLRFQADEPWNKVYGPLFVYINQGATTDAMWEDAKQRAAKEVDLWPYAWMKNTAYPLQRGAVTGRVKLSDGASVKGAWAILAPPDEDWFQVLKGYDFWARVDDQGRFRIDKVRPGRYTLVISAANQFEDFRRDNVEVTAGAVADLKDVLCQTVKHGRTLWQIGIADHSSSEFKGGDNYRHYENFARYPKEFPEDVTFIIGRSKEKEDWNFAQWAIYSKKPYWTIQFDQPQPPKGKATLTIGFASTIPPKGSRTNLEIKVNGHEVEVVHLPKSGMSGYRSGNQDSVYSVVYISFDAALLKKGTNEITLGHAEAQPFSSSDRHGVPGEVMYDAIRLEVQ